MNIDHVKFEKLMNAVWAADRHPLIRKHEIIWMHSFALNWVQCQCPDALNQPQLQKVIDDAHGLCLSMAQSQKALAHLIEAGWLSCERVDGQISSAGLGPVLAPALSEENEGGRA